MWNRKKVKYKSKSMKTTRMLNIDILSLTQQELLGRLEKGVLVTPNVDHLVKLQSDNVEAPFA